MPRRSPLPAGRRLSCSTLVQGDVVIDVPAEQPGAPAGGAQGAPRRAPSSSIRWSACTTSRCAEPDMHDPSGDLQRLCEGARARMGA